MELGSTTQRKQKNWVFVNFICVITQKRSLSGALTGSWEPQVYFHYCFILQLYFHFDCFILDGIRFHTLYRHDPSFSNELKIEPGDIVIGIEKDMNGWMKGKKENSGEIGMFPAIYVEEITQVLLRR